MNMLDSNTRLLVRKSLDYLWQKQRVTAENIANAETPGYKAKHLTFEDELRRNIMNANRNFKGPAPSIRRKIENAINSTNINTHKTDNQTSRLDGNNVNIDVENVELARTQLQYQTLIEFLLRDQRMRTVIDGR